MNGKQNRASTNLGIRRLPPRVAPVPPPTRRRQSPRRLIDIPETTRHAFLMRGRALKVLLIWALVSNLPVGAQPASEVKFGDLTQKFTRNLQLLGTLSNDPEILKMVKVIATKAEDVKYFNNIKNADERRSRIIKQMEDVLHREGIQQSDQRKLTKLREELQELDPDGNFRTARVEIQRSIGEFQTLLSQIHAPDPRSQDIIRLLRQHLSYYQQCLSKMPD
jgi:hypothetical protein